MSKIVNGRKPLSEKKQAVTYDDLFGNMFSIPADVQKDLDAKGLEGRFISYPKFVKMGNQHDRGWVPYVKPESLRSASALGLGASTDGTIRRGDSVFAVRPKEICEQHRNILRDKSDRQSQGASSKALSRAMKAEFRAAGVENTVKETDQDD